MDKQDELRMPTSCLNKAAPDEPIFVLRAKDSLAPQALRLWAQMANGVHEPEKIAEAMHLAERMEKWRTERVPQAINQEQAAHMKEARELIRQQGLVGQSRY